MKLHLIVENANEDSFESHLKHDEQYDTMLDTIKQAETEFYQITVLINRLQAEHVLLVDWKYKQQIQPAGFPAASTFAPRPESDFKEIFTLKDLSKDNVTTRFFVDLAKPKHLVNRALKIPKRQRIIYDELGRLRAQMPKMIPKAADDYIERGRSTPKAEVPESENGEGLFYYDAELKKKWLHNPLKFYEAPHYSGSPEHYDWPAKQKKTFFVVSRWLKSHGLPALTKLYAGVEDGNPHFVTTTADHSFVWQFDGGMDKLHVAGHGMLNAAKLETEYGLAIKLEQAANKLWKMKHRPESLPPTPTQP